MRLDKLNYPTIKRLRRIVWDEARTVETLFNCFQEIEKKKKKAGNLQTRAKGKHKFLIELLHIHHSLISLVNIRVIRLALIKKKQKNDNRSLVILSINYDMTTPLRSRPAE